ncbi:unnamed protein product, partial [Adineta steineri]|uniref:Polymerase nucleotidyl transferase domain-containing protein n=1 Tax=Adineta steineri TaxID=433720 RepID=A0A820BT89_9BILA
MDHSAISSILQELNLNEQDVANIYHHGSWVYGTNSPTSDRDLIIVTHTHQDPLKFHCDLDYFHAFELYKLWNQYDICVYSKENFEKTLEKNYLCSIQCLFLPNEFKIKEEIDFKKIYLEKYYNQSRLKLVAFYEMKRDMDMYKSGNPSSHPSPSSRSLGTSELRMNYIFKNLFHGLRYLDFAEQLIQTKSIHDFKRVSHILDEMKEIRDDPTDSSSMERVFEFVEMKSNEYKSKLDLLVLTNIINGSFEVYITFDCSNDTMNVINNLAKVCENTKYKIIFIALDNNRKTDKVQEQLIVSSQYDGEYPSIVKQIEEEVYKYFQDFSIIRIKIKVSTANESVLLSDIEKDLFWSKTTNYFELRYTIPVRRSRKRDDLPYIQRRFQRLIRNNHTLHVSHDAFQKAYGNDLRYVITIRFFNGGAGFALVQHSSIIGMLEREKFSPLKVVQEFVVHDTNIKLDNCIE